MYREKSLESSSEGTALPKFLAPVALVHSVHLDGEGDTHRHKSLFVLDAHQAVIPPAPSGMNHHSPIEG